MVLSEIESHTQAGISPVTGNKFKALSKNYKERKKDMGKGTDPDLHLKDEMIASISTSIKSTGIDFKITDSTQKKKAFNHIVGDTLPKRPFIPDDGSKKTREATFSGKIKEAIREIINANKD